MTTTSPTPPAASAPDGTSAPAPPTRINWMWRLLQGIVVLIFPGLFRWRLEVEGIEHVPESGPGIVTWNHHSYSDFLMLGLALVRGRHRVVRLLGKAEIWENPVLAWIADQASAVPVYRGRRGGGGAFDAAIEALERGDLVGLAPEQTISQSFELLPFASGAARMAQASGAPVIPSAGWGSHRLSTKGHTFQAAFGIPVVTAFGPPIHVAADEDVHAASERIRAATESLLHGIQEDYPDRPSSPEDSWWLPARMGGSAPPHAEVEAAHLDRMQHRSR